jgi:tetratricopeptide (TPR) repeat protein
MFPQKIRIAMNNQSYLYGIIGLLAGLIIGYIGTNYINQSYGPAPAAGINSAASNNLPSDHPPTGGPAADQGAGPQSDVTSVIDRARNEPSNFEAQMEAGKMFAQIKRFEGALEFFERAYKVKPGDGKLLIALGDSNFDLGRYEEAERWYQLALKQNPKDPIVRMDLGLTYYFRTPRDLDSAITAFREALKVDPRHEKSLQNLTRALIDKGDKAGARESLKQLEQVNPVNQAIPQFRAEVQ